MKKYKLLAIMFLFLIAFSCSADTLCANRIYLSELSIDSDEATGNVQVLLDSIDLTQVENAGFAYSKFNIEVKCKSNLTYFNVSVEVYNNLDAIDEISFTNITSVINDTYYAYEFYYLIVAYVNHTQNIQIRIYSTNCYMYASCLCNSFVQTTDVSLLETIFESTSDILVAIAPFLTIFIAYRSKRKEYLLVPPALSVLLAIIDIDYIFVSISSFLIAYLIIKQDKE